MVLELLDAGEKVVVVDNLSTGFWWVLPQEVPLIVGDVGDQTLMERVIRENKVEAIAHFAAKIVVPDSVADPLDYYYANTVKTRALIEAATKCGVKHFIFSSTAAVYGEPKESRVSEDTLLAPINPYGRSKLMSEWMLADTARAHPLTYVALRYFNVAGADPKGRAGQSGVNATHLIKVACQAALGKRSHLSVFGQDYPTRDGSCIRDYIQVSDLVRAHALALAHLRGGGKSLTLNCGYGDGFSVMEVVDVVKKVSGVDFDVRLEGRRSGDPAMLVASASKIRKLLGWKPRYDDLEIIVRQALDWEAALARRNAA
jgi:UDP-glucose 4-epimerase